MPLRCEACMANTTLTLQHWGCMSQPHVCSLKFGLSGKPEIYHQGWPPTYPSTIGTWPQRQLWKRRSRRRKGHVVGPTFQVQPIAKGVECQTFMLFISNDTCWFQGEKMITCHLVCCGVSEKVIEGIILRIKNTSHWLRDKKNQHSMLPTMQGSK